MAEPTIAELDAALSQAEAAGDTQAAQEIAALLGATSTTTPATQTETEPSGFFASVGAGVSGAVNAASTFLLETAKDRYRREMEMALQREREGKKAYPGYTPEKIKEGYETAVGLQVEMDAIHKSVMDELDYEEAEWKSGEHWARVKQVVGSAIGSTIPILLTGPAAPLTAYAMSGGQILNELKDIRDLSASDKLKIAQLGGIPLAALERSGLKAIMGKGLIKGAAREAMTELLAEMGVISIGAMSGREYEALEVLTRGGESALGGAGTGPAIKVPVQAAKIAKQGVEEVVTGWEYGQDTDRLMSDERVARAYAEKLQSMDKAATNEQRQPFNVFKTIGKDAAYTIADALKSLQRTGVITKEDTTALNRILDKAKKQSQVMDQADFDAIENLQVTPEIKTALQEALRDLNTTVEYGMDKNTRGPAQEFMRKYSTLVGLGAGAKSGIPGAAIVLGTMTEGFGRSLDTVARARVPKVLKGQDARRRLIEKAQRDITNPLKILEGIQADVASGIQLATDERQLAIEAGRRMRRDRRKKNIPGRMGFDRYIYEGDPQRGIAGTGLLPNEVDKGLVELLMRREISMEQFRQFHDAPNMLMVGNQGNHIIDALEGLAVEGLIRPDPNADPATLAGYGIRNPASYNATVRSAEVARDAAYQSINEAGLSPQQAQALIGLTDQIVQLKNKSEKRALLATALQTMPKAAAEITRKVISPLADYGSIDPATAAKVEQAINK